jgi:hypothetical protein
LKGGRLLISVHTENAAETERAKAIFVSVNAEDISTSSAPSVANTR